MAYIPALCWIWPAMPSLSEAGGLKPDVGRLLSRWGAVGGLVVLLLWIPEYAQAAERSVSDIVLVDRGTVIEDDLYAAGNRIVIDGRVDGDLIVAAYEDVTIRGTVTGDVLGVAGQVIIDGRVGESVRVVSPRVDVTGEVGRDVIISGWDVTLASEVSGDVTLWAWAVDMAGRVQGDLEGQMRHLLLGGRIGMNVDVTVTDLRVAPGAAVGRDLGYRSGDVAAGVEEAEIGGIVVHRLPLAPNVRIRALWILAKVALGLMAAVIGLLVTWASPGAADRAAGAVRASWWRSWLRGLATMALPLVVVTLMVLLLWLAPTQAGLPLIGVLLPLLSGVLGVVVMLGFLSPAAAFPWLGRAGNPQRGPVRAFLYGTAVVIVAGLIPWLAWAIVLFVVPLGVGGWLSLLSNGGSPASTVGG